MQTRATCRYSTRRSRSCTTSRTASSARSTARPSTAFDRRSSCVVAMCECRRMQVLDRNVSSDGDDKNEAIRHPSRIWGPTCDSADLLFKCIALPELHIGDWLLFQACPHVYVFNVSVSTLCRAWAPTRCASRASSTASRRRACITSSRRATSASSVPDKHASFKTQNVRRRPAAQAHRVDFVVATAERPDDRRRAVGQRHLAHVRRGRT